MPTFFFVKKPRIKAMMIPIKIIVFKVSFRNAVAQ